VRQPISFIASDRPKEAQAFYTDILGLALLETSPFALVFADGHQVLRVQIVADMTPAPYTAHGWQVTDIMAEIATLTAKGVTFLRFDKMPQDAQGVWNTPDAHMIAWFNDPRGNILSLTQVCTG